MAWGILVGVIAVSAVLLVALGKAKSHGVASNALLAEHALGYVELVPANPFAKRLRDAVIAVLRSGSRSNITEEEAVEWFNRESRVVQLNLVAMALEMLGQTPMIRKERWSPVANPFVSAPNATRLSSAATYLVRRYGIRVSIPERRLKLLSWGISDDEVSTSGPAPQPLTQGPLIVGGTPIRAYLCEGLKAVLVNEPKAIGPAEYLFALIVYLSDGTRPVLVVAAEKSMASKFIQELSTEIRETFAADVGDTVFLGVFDSEGHSNLGPSEDCASVERFEARALREMRERLGLMNAEIKVIAEHAGAA